MKRKLAIFIVSILILFVSVAPGLASPQFSSLTIETTIDFVTIIGTFEVVEGASELGCSSGTFLDDPSGRFPL